MEPMGQVLHIPANPRWQRAVLVVLVHGREVAPLLIAAEFFHKARFEINPEPLPPQEPEAGPRRRMMGCKTRPESGRREEEREEAGFQQHAVRLIAGEVARGADKRKKANETNEERYARPKVDKCKQ